VIWILRIRTLKAAAVSEAEGAAWKQGEIAGGEPGSQPTTRLKERFAELAVFSDWSCDVLHIATVGFGDEIIESCRYIAGDANVLAGG
jgi:hypothetical protein